MTDRCDVSLLWRHFAAVPVAKGYYPWSDESQTGVANNVSEAAELRSGQSSRTVGQVSSTKPTPKKVRARQSRKQKGVNKEIENFARVLERSAVVKRICLSDSTRQALIDLCRKLAVK